MATPSWTVVEPSLPALTYTYALGSAVSNALAVVVEGGVIVVSPPVDPPAGAVADLAKHGPVLALVAPNAFHYMGIPAWKTHFPDAAVFAPAQSIARVEKKLKIAGIRPIAEASKLLGDRVEMIDMPHYKSGEVLVRWRMQDGWAWYVTDVAFNFTALPKGLFGMLCKLTKSGPGLRRNGITGAIVVKDKRALYAWLADEAEAKPPGLVVACHGDAARLEDPAGEIRAAFA